ncbi:hypothetical protein OG235_36865 [Streptomyces sp. NBC_00024]|uniref:hypothetical protein n=1 Tax=Streptomyces sp. NBC_00024 TaxID=2903612 RepID=UPI00324C6A50
MQINHPPTRERTMDIRALTEEIELIAGAGDADDALGLMRALLASGQTQWAIEIRRAVSGGKLDREALIATGEKLGRQVIEHREQARRELRKATRDLVRNGGDNIITRGARELARFI